MYSRVTTSCNAERVFAVYSEDRVNAIPGTIGVKREDKGLLSG